MKKEELLIEKQKIVIDKIVNHLSTLGQSLYYEPTINICHEIYNIIHNEKFLKQKDKEAVIKLDSKDIQVLLSYNSSCC